MDTEIYLDEEDIPTPSQDEYDFTSFGGGMFAGSHHFTLAGGTFNNNMNNYVAAPTVPPDFRMIPMGDIDLRHELMVDEKLGIVGRRQEHNCVRRLYSAKIDGRRSKVTVAVYQGDDAEEDWGRDTAMYMSVRHPNTVQIWAAASCGNIHATVFHGDLVPLETFLARQSPVMKVYFHGCYSADWRRVERYFKSLSKNLSSPQCTFWVRTSTDRLSVDPAPTQKSHTRLSLSSLTLMSRTFVETPLVTPSGPLNTEVLAIESLLPRQYHQICALHLSQYRDDSIPTSATVHLGSVISWPSGHRAKDHIEIASFGKLDLFYNLNDSWQISGHAGDLTGNGWRRYRADCVSNTNLMVEVYCYGGAEGWLSQANHVFSRLQITSDLENYVRIEDCYFTLTIGNTRGYLPAGFLFICPREEFRTGLTSIRWPDRPAYWSLDPEGIKALSTEEAAYLGFPPFQLTTQIHGRSWDTSVYAGLHKFHQVKGFDPDSQEIAIHLGHRLYQFSKNEGKNSPFAHVDDFTEAEATADEVDTDDEWADAQSSMHEDSGSDEGSDAEDGVGEAKICVKQPVPQVDQESMDSDCGYTGTNDKANLKPQTANDPRTGRGFIHRIFGALRHSLVVEVDSDNIDSDPISPFLV